MRPKNGFGNSDSALRTIFSCWRLVGPDAKKKVALISAINIFLNFLDLVAVGLIGVVGSLAARGTLGSDIGERTERVLSLIGIQTEDLKLQIISLCLVAFSILVLRSVLVYYFMKKIFLFLSNEASKLSKKLIFEIIEKPINVVNRLSPQEYIFHLNSGTSHLMLGILGTAFNLISDLTLFIFLITLLILADPESAAASGAIFVFVGVFLHFLMSGRAKLLGQKTKQLSVEFNERVLELINSLREIITRNSQQTYANVLFKDRNRIVKVTAEQKMMPIFSKYTLEITALATFLIVAVLQFILNDAFRAVGNLALFLAASSRISPAILRIQQGIVQIKGSIGSGESTLQLLKSESLGSPEMVSAREEERDFGSKIEFKDVSFSFEKTKDNWLLSKVSFAIEPNTFVGIVGPSGAGKSTIVDLLFGLIEPNDGEVLIGGVTAREALSLWPGNFGFVPQNAMIHKGTIMSNLLMGLERNRQHEESAKEALHLVGMYDFVMSLEGGLDYVLNDKGSNFSGGQRQRLGIARALVTKPRILVLDESTSSLDAVSEHLITESLMKLRSKITIIVVAHRLSTVKLADKLLYIDSGKLVSEARFEELRKQISDFDRQANLMGI